MRVWVYPEKVYEEFGAVRWEVEWQEVPSNWALLSDEQKEEYDYDKFQFCFATFKTESAAQRFAKKQAKHRANAYGCATVTKQVVDWFVEEDRVAEWSSVGNSESYP